MPVEDLARFRVKRRDWHRLASSLGALHRIDGVGATTRPNPKCPGAPLFPSGEELLAWTRTRFVNNCYAYANDVRSDVGPLMPGGDEFKSATLQDMAARVERDGLVHVGRTLPADPLPIWGGHYVAICLRRQAEDRYRDFHCLRLDRDGRWSHKDGIGVLQRTDAAGQPIVDLGAARFATPHVLVGFFRTGAPTRSLLTRRSTTT